jgi:hypothetical protein
MLVIIFTCLSICMFIFLRYIRALIELSDRQNVRKTLPANKLSTPSSTEVVKSSVIARHTALPFILAHDLPRGIIAAALALLGFLFMLAVMCVQIVPMLLCLSAN